MTQNPFYNNLSFNLTTQTPRTSFSTLACFYSTTQTFGPLVCNIIHTQNGHNRETYNCHRGISHKNFRTIYDNSVLHVGNNQPFYEDIAKAGLDTTEDQIKTVGSRNLLCVV